MILPTANGVSKPQSSQSKTKLDKTQVSPHQHQQDVLNPDQLVPVIYTVQPTTSGATARGPAIEHI